MNVVIGLGIFLGAFGILRNLWELIRPAREEQARSGGAISLLFDIVAVIVGLLIAGIGTFL